jgi:hypothetical protein
MARLAAVVVFPSPGPVLVTTIERMPRAESEKRRFVLSVLNASEPGLADCATATHLRIAGRTTFFFAAIPSASRGGIERPTVGGRAPLDLGDHGQPGELQRSLQIVVPADGSVHVVEDEGRSRHPA